MLVREMAPRLGAGRPAAPMKPRVFVVGFPGTRREADAEDLDSERSYDPTAAHMRTVVGNEALVLDAARRYPHATFFGLNLGLVKTDIRSDYLGRDSLLFRISEGLIGLVMPSAERYAERTVPLLVSPGVEAFAGAMFDSRARAIPPSPCMSDDLVTRFVAASEALLERALARAAAAESRAPG